MAGLAAARLLARTCEVTVYEAEAELGGHASTVSAPHDSGAILVDIGFQLFHERNNPNLRALFASLGVATEPVPFTLSVTSGGDAWTNNGARTPFSERMLGELTRFSRAAPILAGMAPDTSLRELLAHAGYSADFQHKVLAPLLCFWWVSRTSLFDIPAFAVGSGMLQGAFPFFAPATFHRPRDGALDYVRRLAEPIADRLYLATRVLRVERNPDAVVLHDARGGCRVFDQVVLAVDAATALALLDEPSEEEQAVLGGIRFETATLITHHDERVMPANRFLWSYGNYRDTEPTGEPGVLGGEMTYWAPRPGRPPMFVTVAGPHTTIPEQAVVARRTWRHMVVDAASAARSVRTIQGCRRTWFAGGHTVGYPVHEHALCSGFAVAEALGEPYPFATDDGARRTYEAFRARALAPRQP